MHDTSALWKQIFSEADHKTEVMVKVNGVEYNEDRILAPGPSIVGKLFDAPSAGNCRARTLNLSIMPYDAPRGRVPPMSEILLFVRLKSADGQRVSEYISKGVFYADEVKRDSVTGAVSVTAFDAMMKMERNMADRIVRVAFDDGYGGIQRFVREIGDDMPAPETPAHSGEAVAGWYPDPADTRELSRDMYFIMRWKQKYTVAFDDGSETPQTFSSFEGDPTPTPETPVKTGYVFAGWTPTPAATVTENATYTAQWVESGVIDGGDWWTLYDTGLLYIYCEGDMPDYYPSHGYGYAPWYGHRQNIISVTIRNSVTSIGSYAFDSVANLTSVTIPNNVTKIGVDAFVDCTGLTSVTIPDSVTSMGGAAFAGCTGLTNVVIPDSVTTMGISIFYGCTGLTSVTIGNRVTSIKEYAFYGCTSLTSLTIPDSVISIKEYAFFGCTSLTSLTIPDSVTSIETAAVENCAGLINVRIGNSVITIGQVAFSGCTGLTSLTIGSSVTKIDYSAFYHCERLADVYYTGSQSQWEAINIKGGNADLTSATIHYNSSGPS